MKKTTGFIIELIEIIKTLRGPNGCPWDRKQSPADVKDYLVEELYELLEAIDMDEKEMLVEETGDLLFMILFLINLYEENDRFTLADSLKSIKTKMIHRHPHVFGNKTVSSVEEVKQNWQVLKEKEGKAAKESLLDNIPKSLPALYRSFFLTSNAAKAGFDWQHAGEVLEKIREETAELEDEIKEGTKEKITDEIGDLFFSIVNLSRHLGIDPEQALQRTNEKFIFRFKHVEKELKKRGKDIKNATLSEMDNIWEEAKKIKKDG
jgi:MazG family protein